MNSFKITYTDGSGYTTSANGTLREFTDYLMQDDGVHVEENPVTGKETRRTIAKIEQIQAENEYCIIGSSRQVGAIGIPEDFRVYHIAKTPRIAYNEVRENLYKDGREHILIKEILLDGVTVAPDSYWGNTAD